MSQLGKVRGFAIETGEIVHGTGFSDAGSGRLLSSSMGVPLAAEAQPACRNTGDFGRWMQGFRQEAAQAGISQRTIAAALDGVTLDDGIIRSDRGQGFFAQSFLEFQAKLATAEPAQQRARLRSRGIAASSTRSRRNTACRRR